ncbi:MAG: AEC family transporter [Clostridia bacterium]|nr:AEC family transporter [Clostridia bacterium]
MEYVYPILEQIGIMFLIILVGYILYKLKVITAEGRKQLSEVMLTIVCPSLIFMVYQIDVTPEIIRGILWSFVLSILSMVIGIGIARLVIPKKAEDFQIGRLCIGYTNCAFMGIPIIEGIFGSEGVIYLTSYITMFNLLAWTHGVMLITGQKSFSGLIKVAKNPTIIALALGLICFVTGIRIPEIPATALNYIKSLNTPVAMLIAGATMAQSDMLGAVRKMSVMGNVFIKLLVVPVVVMLVFKLLPVPSEMIFTCNVIATACPTATIVTLFALRYDKNAVRASEIFAISTLLSGITLPVITVLSNWVFNL